MGVRHPTGENDEKPALILKYAGKEGNYRPTFGNCSKLFKKPLIALDFPKCSLKIVETAKRFEDAMEGLILPHSVDYGGVNEIEHSMKIAKKTSKRRGKSFRRLWRPR